MSIDPFFVGAIPFQDRKLNYRFYPHFHPYIPQLVERHVAGSVAGLLRADTAFKKNTQGVTIIPSGRPQPKDYDLYLDYFTTYGPNPDLVDGRHPADELDFSSSGAYALYNWELFFHVPFTVAVHLSKNQRFEEAQGWFHFIFDPTDDSDGPTPARFWKVREFQTSDVMKLEDLLVNLSTGADAQLRADTIASIDRWKSAPFRPHAVARYRSSAYMLKTVMAYLDNLVAWGDMLFRQDTGESINEAAQLYVLAANILGPRPQAVPKKGSLRPQCYRDLRESLDPFRNVLADLEADIPFELGPSAAQSTHTGQLSTIESMGKSALYFGVPRNEKLLSYWDAISDRLFKIRNSLSLAGVFRQLPLFEPRIDPGLLAKAAAAGLDVGEALSGINQPLPLVRFQLLAQKAAEICQEVKALGGSVLSAIEKEDNEALTMLRAKHERVILGLAEAVKYGQWQEAIKSREGLERSLGNATQRYTYYEQLLGVNPADIRIPSLDPLDALGLENMKFEAAEPDLGSGRSFHVDLAPASEIALLEQQSGGRKLNKREVEEIAKLKGGRVHQEVIEVIEGIAAFMAPMPDSSMSTSIGFIGFGLTGMGGTMMSKAASATASIHRGAAAKFSYEAGNAARIGAWDRRELDWALQSNLAACDITQTFKQLRAAQIREAVAEREWENHRQQIRHAEDVEHYLAGEKSDSGPGKITVQAFYAWMKREVRALHAQCFEFAFEVARKAERALQHELGNPEASFLRLDYLSSKEGLMAGEKLSLDIKHMEIAYHELNEREYELTKHVSLLQVDPMALLQLRATGSCNLSLPEELFDMDGPGHYFRRVKSVAVSIPCVGGPYTSVNCTLTLLRSKIRKSALMVGDEGYARRDAEDARFSDDFGGLPSIVTSTAQGDSGLFETNLRDERYLPFEYAGVISDWQLELPANPSRLDPRAFDYDTISDVILHIRYTAREGGSLLRSGAITNLKKRIEDASAPGLVRLFSVRHEFPTEWAAFQGQPVTDDKRSELVLKLREEHYPFWSQQNLKGVKKVGIIARSAQAKAPDALTVFDIRDKSKVARQDSLIRTSTLGSLLLGEFTNGSKGMLSPSSPLTTLTLCFDDRSLRDLWIAMTWCGTQA